MAYFAIFTRFAVKRHILILLTCVRRCRNLKSSLGSPVDRYAYVYVLIICYL